MFGVDGWRALTGLDEDVLLAEAETGKVRFVFNLAGKDAERKYLRVWVRSALAFRYPNANFDQPPHDNLLAALHWHEDPILPHRKEALRCSELYRAFNVCSSHFLNLLDGELLVRAPMHDTHPAASPLITRASVFQLLTERRIE